MSRKQFALFSFELPAAASLHSMFWMVIAWLIGTHSCKGCLQFFFFPPPPEQAKTVRNLMRNRIQPLQSDRYSDLPPFYLSHLQNSPLLIKGMACPLSCDYSLPDRILTAVWEDRPFFCSSHSQSSHTHISDRMSPFFIFRGFT